MFCKKGAFRNFGRLTGKHLCQSLFFNKVAGLNLFYRTPLDDCLLFKKDTLAWVCFCEFCEISRNTFSYRTPLVAVCIENTVTQWENYEQYWFTNIFMLPNWSFGNCVAFNWSLKKINLLYVQG